MDIIGKGQKAAEEVLEPLYKIYADGVVFDAYLAALQVRCGETVKGETQSYKRLASSWLGLRGSPHNRPLLKIR